MSKEEHRERERGKYNAKKQTKQKQNNNKKNRF